MDAEHQENKSCHQLGKHKQSDIMLTTLISDVYVFINIMSMATLHNDIHLESPKNIVGLNIVVQQVVFGSDQNLYQPNKHKCGNSFFCQQSVHDIMCVKLFEIFEQFLIL